MQQWPPLHTADAVQPSLVHHVLLSTSAWCVGYQQKTVYGLYVKMLMCT